jgi:site-specific DNA recombinase
MNNHHDGQAYAAIYARVSTEDQARGYSLPSQIEACHKLAEHAGYRVPESYVFSDDVTGDHLERPGLRKLRELVQTNAIAAAIIYDVDRLSRRMVPQLLFEEECERAGVALLVVMDPMEAGPEGTLRRHIKGAFAEWEKAKILERTRRGMVRRIQAGHPGGGVVPLGWRALSEPHGGRWEVDTDEAALVQRIFALCLSGLSTRKIATQLTAERIPTPSQRHADPRTDTKPPLGVWGHPTVRGILTNPAYMGQAVWGTHANLTKTTRRRRPESEWVHLTVPPIVDTETFHAAQAALQQHQALAIRNRKYDYLLCGGRLRCGRCGRGTTGICRKSGIRYYRCNSHHYLMDPSLRCPGVLRADVVEAQVWAAVIQVLEQPELIATEVARQETHAEAQRAEIGQQMALLDAALAKCDREAQRWADAYAGEVINLAELKGYRADIEARRQGLLTEQGALQAQLDAIGMAVQQVDALTEYCARVLQRLQAFDHPEKLVALQALDIRVSWMPGQPFTIQGSIPMGAIVDIPSKRRTCQLHYA